MTSLTMKFALLALVACSSLALVSGNIFEKEGHLHDLRRRLGHFKESPYTDLYKQYAAAFVLPKHKHDRAKDDYRNYMPSGQECMVFFRSFRISQYAVKDFEELVVLDACLGYIFDNENLHLDTDNDDKLRSRVAELQDDEVLQNLYKNTKVNDLGEAGQSCVADLLLNNIIAKNQYQDVECNNHFIQLYLQFAECQAHNNAITKEQREGDSYLEIIYRVLKDRVRTCFDVEIDAIKEAIREAYTRERKTRVKNKVLRRFNPLKKQQDAYMWPTPIVNLLAAVQNTSTEINTREVHQLVRGFYENDERLIERFTNNIAYYADRMLKPKPTDKGGDKAAQERYQDLVDKLCSFFRSSDHPDKYDYATPLIRMVELLNHQEIFEFTSKNFVDLMLVRARENHPVYLGVSACNILTFTEASIPGPNKNTKQHYKVVFVPDTSRMVKWPYAEYY